MDEQREQARDERPEPTGEVAEGELEQLAAGGDTPPVNVDLLGFRRALVDTSPIHLT